MKILVVHEVNYLSKIIYEFQILPEILSMMNHEVTIVDYDDSWASEQGRNVFDLQTRVHEGVHRAYPTASVTVRRPGMVRIPVLSRISGAITSGIEVERILRRSKPDVILLYGIPTVGLQALLAAKLNRVPVIFRSIDVTSQLVPYRVLAPITRVLERLVYQRVHGILTVTPHLKKYIQSFGVAESNVDVLPSGVDAEMFSPGERNPGMMQRWGIRPHHRVILFMGTLYKFSGLEQVIRGFPQLLTDHPNARIVIAGIGPDESRLKGIVHDKSLSEQVIFTGLQAYTELPDLIRSSDICINPFELNAITADILPTKLFQYLACGKPVLATKLPGTLPFLAGEQHGVVYASLGEFMDGLGELLKNREKCAELGRRGEQTARCNYDWHSIAAKLIEYLEARIN